MAHELHERSDARALTSDAAQDARIEQLLLQGLDAYFAGRYEEAITLWTRVLFLDRRHDRARAYIDRARSAQAERQRESEATLHQGIEAFHGGDVARARRLVTDAIEGGAPIEAAQGMLDRIDRLRVGQSSPSTPAGPPLPLAPEAVEAPLVPPVRPVRRPSGLLLLMAAAGVLVVAVWGFAVPDSGLWPLAGTTPSDLRAAPATVARLPLAEAYETHLSRARAHVASGRLSDALAELDRIPIGDPLRVQADRVRAQVQQALLSVAGDSRAVGGVGSSALPRPPE
ncbi:MAG: hypothetical protein ACT4QD_23940 [Acidobacteriota bacterium]